MIEVTHFEFYAFIESLGLDKIGDGIPVGITEPPRTIYKKDGTTVAIAIWHDDKDQYLIKK